MASGGSNRNGFGLVGGRNCGNASEGADAPAEIVSFAEFCRHTHSYLAALLRPRRRTVFFHPQPNSGARLFSTCCGRGIAAVRADHVCAFALVRRLDSRFGSRLPLLVGPTIAAAGFALFAIPGTGAGYWMGFFPGVVVLGLGMAISVAPLTTTIMGSVPNPRLELSLGINNAVARRGPNGHRGAGSSDAAGVQRGLERRLAAINFRQTRNAIFQQRIKLGGIDVDGAVLQSPAKSAMMPEQTTKSIEQAIKESFVSGLEPHANRCRHGPRKYVQYVGLD